MRQPLLLTLLLWLVLGAPLPDAPLSTRVRAQTLTRQANGPEPGESYYFYEEQSTDVDYPDTVTEGQVFDYSALGDLVDECFDLPLRDIPLDSLFRVTYFTPDLAGTTDPVLSQLPATALGTRLTGSLETEGLTPEQVTAFTENYVEVRDDGLYALTESTLILEIDGENSRLDIERDVLLPPELIVPYGLAIGGQLTAERSIVGPSDFEDNELDSTFLVQMLEALPPVTLRTFYGEFPNTRVFRINSTFEFYTRDTTTSEPFQFRSVQTTEELVFYPENYANPALILSVGGSSTLASFARLASPPTSVARREATQLALTTAPNPATDFVRVGFTTGEAAPAQLRLLNATGQEVARRDYGRLRAGEQSLTFALPATLPGGHYFLQVVSGERTTARRVVVSR